MPNSVQKFARQFLKRLRRVASSTSSPPIAPLPGEVQAEAADFEIAPTSVDISEITKDSIQTLPQTESENSSIRSGSSSSNVDEEAEQDIIIELEAIKSLRVEDALVESRRIKEAYEEKPKMVNVKRLMKELRQVKKACEESNGAYVVEPCSIDNDDDSDCGTDLSEWEARFYQFDENSNLWKSMKEYGIDCVTFRISFPADFPFSPPFVRLVSPYIENGFVMNGGAICLEVLTSQGWSSAYTMEALLVQVASALAHGGAVVSKHQKRKQQKLTKKRAEVEFRRIIKIHNKYGWVKLDKEEG